MNDQPKLVLIRGLPGSVNSFIANLVAKKLGEDKVTLLDPDATDYQSQEYLEMSEELTRQKVDEKFHPYRFLRARAHAGIEKNNIILWNQAFTNLDGFQKTINNLTNYANDEKKQLPLLVVEVNVDRK